MPTMSASQATTEVSRHASRGAGKAGLWSTEEDELLRKLVVHYGAQNWAAIAAYFPTRSNKSCRLRWFNELRPGIKKDDFSDWEDAVIAKAAAEQGTKWATIARLLPGRTDNSVKNRWHVISKQQRKETPVASSFYDNLSLDELLSVGSSAKSKCAQGKKYSGGDITRRAADDNEASPPAKKQRLEPVTPPRATTCRNGYNKSPSNSLTSASSAQYNGVLFDRFWMMGKDQHEFCTTPSSASVAAAGPRQFSRTTNGLPTPAMNLAPATFNEPDGFCKFEQPVDEHCQYWPATPVSRYAAQQQCVDYTALKPGFETCGWNGSLEYSLQGCLPITEPLCNYEECNRSEVSSASADQELVRALFDDCNSTLLGC